MIKVNGREVVFRQFPNKETLFRDSQFEDLRDKKHLEVFFKYEEDADLIKFDVR